MKWLENLEDYDKSNLIEIDGTRATNLKEVDGVANSLSLTTDTILNKSQLFKPIKDKGDRVYLRGLFKIMESQIDAYFYTNSKITISKKKASDMTMDKPNIL